MSAKILQNFQTDTDISLSRSVLINKKGCDHHFSIAEQKEWVLNEIGETLREYQHFTAK